MTQIDKLIILEYRDDMMQEMMQKIRFNRFDMKFMMNINAKYIAKDRALSKNQNDLYEKLIHKYRRQFRKVGAPYEKVLSKTWRHPIVSSSALRKQTFFRLQELNNEVAMQLYFNFDKKAIDEVRALVHDDDGNHLNKGAKGVRSGNRYNYLWNNDTKIWSGKFDVYLFKQLYKFANTHDVNVDSSIHELIAGMTERYGKAALWQPSVHIINDVMYINNVTETMLPCINDIDMSDLSVRNVERLTKLGLQPPSDYADIEEYVTCQSTNYAHQIVTVQDVDKLKSYVTQSCRKVLFLDQSRPWLSENKNGSSDIRKAIVGWDDPNVTMLSTREHFLEVTTDILLARNYDTLITTQSVQSLYSGQNEFGHVAQAVDKIILVDISE